MNSSVMTATAVSIVTSSINGATQSIGEMPVSQAQTHVISNNAFMLFSMTMAATTNFLNQFAILPLYGMMATQKMFVCSTNSVLGVIGTDRMSMRIGDPSIQNASDRASGKCMTQNFAESTQGEGSGSDNAATAVAGTVAQIGQLFQSIQLDMLVHHIDASFTWMQGVISGLQDVIQTIYRNRSVIS